MGDRDARHTWLHYAVCLVCMEVPGDWPAPSSPAPHGHAPAAPPLFCCIRLSPLVCSGEAPHYPRSACAAHSPSCRRGPGSVCRHNLHKLFKFSGTVSPGTVSGWKPGQQCRPLTTPELQTRESAVVSARAAMSPCLLPHVPARRMSEPVQWGIRRCFECAARHAKAGYCSARCRQARQPPSRPTARHRPSPIFLPCGAPRRSVAFALVHTAVRWVASRVVVII